MAELNYREEAYSQERAMFYGEHTIEQLTKHAIDQAVVDQRIFNPESSFVSVPRAHMIGRVLNTSNPPQDRGAEIVAAAVNDRRYFCDENAKMRFKVDRNKEIWQTTLKPSMAGTIRAFCLSEVAVARSVYMQDAAISSMTYTEAVILQIIKKRPRIELGEGTLLKCASRLDDLLRPRSYGEQRALVEYFKKDNGRFESIGRRKRARSEEVEVFVSDARLQQYTEELYEEVRDTSPVELNEYTSRIPRSLLAKTMLTVAIANDDRFKIDRDGHVELRPIDEDSIAGVREFIRSVKPAKTPAFKPRHQR